MRFTTRMLIVPALAAAAFAAHAGTVTVSFVRAVDYADAGNNPWDGEANLNILAGHLYKLGQAALPADQVLKIDVLELELAGTVVVSRPRGVPTRLLVGGADWPQMHLRYTLEQGGRILASGDEWVSDRDYMHGLSQKPDSGSLYYERRMLGNWFRSRFVDTPVAPG
jgi:hypothetical protein